MLKNLSNCNKKKSEANYRINPILWRRESRPVLEAVETEAKEIAGRKNRRDFGVSDQGQLS